MKSIVNSPATQLSKSPFQPGAILGAFISAKYASRTARLSKVFKKPLGTGKGTNTTGGGLGALEGGLLGVKDGFLL